MTSINASRPTVTIATGADNDLVEIERGRDDLIHVKVNGREVWSGTEEQAAQLRIDTGGGDDAVYNTVDGVSIATGAGNDRVWNTGDRVTIDTGAGDDDIFNTGDDGRCTGGPGHDRVATYGVGNIFIENQESFRAAMGEETRDEEHLDSARAYRDAAAIREAVEGWGTDEDALVDILSNRSNAEIREIKRAYAEMYGESLEERVDDETSGALCRGLLSMLRCERSESSEIDPVAVERDVERIHTALATWPADGGALADVLSDRSSAEIQAIAARYQRRYGESLRGRIQDMTGGDTEALLLAQLDRRDGTETRATTRSRTSSASAADAAAVRTALMRAPIPDGDALIRLLANKSNDELRELKAAYAEIYGESLESTIEGRTGGDFEDALLAILRASRSENDRADPVQATRDAAAVREAVEGWGTDEEALTEILSSRSPAELRAIASAYREMYGESLRECVDDETSGYYCDTLMTLLDAAGCE